MKTPANNKLAILSSNWRQFPKSAVNLLEIMRELHALKIQQLEREIDLCVERVKTERGKKLSRKTYIYILDKLNPEKGKFYDEIGWKDARLRLSELGCLICGCGFDGWGDMEYSKQTMADSVYHDLIKLKEAIWRELAARKFVMVDSVKSHFLEKKDLFGEQVSASFPSAKDEIQAAGNCLAMDLNTAAVFHMMRAAEFGLRALALNLKVKLKRKPIEHGGWNELIEQIEKKILIRRKKYDASREKNKKELEYLKFCRMMADELFIFKEIWRNNTMHSISSYNESEAKGLFDRVRDFMQRLSKQVSETNS
jgi:hypothetical protein